MEKKTDDHVCLWKRLKSLLASFAAIKDTPVDVFQGVSERHCFLMQHRGELSQDIRKGIVDLCKSGSSLGIIARYPKVP